MNEWYEMFQKFFTYQDKTYPQNVIGEIIVPVVFQPKFPGNVGYLVRSPDKAGKNSLESCTTATFLGQTRFAGRVLDQIQNEHN